ncbi:hypothetical protein HKBW3S44_01563 [Candidatus Hakubella thermalkaliphila]|uniref:Uncharacterized protein n=1 Tax=Candidatus Hakubella thermalkaliphila TaxID=2754717 RepID=A0A6V8Q070_9ACTN|nr:hypothetical protein [Candidatus Hakubella thermalkaliphila]GFP37883.1 hypothetical protein HKBW3S44_01563 [Candidatus Hakubella thermalkaliphila]
MHIYTTSNTILVKGDIDEMLQVVTSDNFTVGDSALFLSNDLDQEQIQFIKEYNKTVLSKGDNAPKITFQKINPTRYEVRVENATSPFFLVFSESYHPGWKVYIESKPFQFNEIIVEYDNTGVKEARQGMITPGDIYYFFKQAIAEDRHFLVNGYANAWYIDPQEVGKEDFTLTLYFLPQSYFYIGLIISGLAFLGCVGYLAFDWKRRRGAREPNKATES